MTESVSDQCILEENPDGHPAVNAWLTLNPGNPRPGKISALYAAKFANKKDKGKAKSAVYRLESVDQTGFSIVAKWCDPKTAELEQIIYERILPQLPISSLQYHGHAKIGDADWLFLEYARGIEWQVDNRTHLELAVQWLADLHGSSAQLDILSLLPYRGPGYYLSQLTTARQRIQESASNPVLAPTDIAILDDFIACSSLLETHWQDIEAFCETMPETLVHNDFVDKNIHVRATKSGPLLLAFDWEMSGRGVPATDLRWMFQRAPDATITRYWEHLREFNRNIGLQDIEYLAVLGEIFRVMDAIEWTSGYLSTENPTGKIHHTRLYTGRLKHAYHALGWA